MKEEDDAWRAQLVTSMESFLVYEWRHPKPAVQRPWYVKHDPEMTKRLHKHLLNVCHQDEVGRYRVFPLKSKSGLPGRWYAIGVFEGGYYVAVDADGNLYQGSDLPDYLVDDAAPPPQWVQPE